LFLQLVKVAAACTLCASFLMPSACSINTTYLLLSNVFELYIGYNGTQGAPMCSIIKRPIPAAQQRNNQSIPQLPS
jgi:beta-lactamase class A